MNKTGQASDRSRTSAEPEKKYLIAGIVIVENELVALQNVSAKTGPKGIAGKFAPIGSQSLIIENDLALGSVFEHPEELIDIGIMTFAAFLACSVREYDDILSHDILLKIPPTPLYQKRRRGDLTNEPMACQFILFEPFTLCPDFRQ